MDSNMYFSQFPTIPYDSKGTGEFKDVKNLLRRVGIRQKVKLTKYLWISYPQSNITDKTQLKLISSSGSLLKHMVNRT